MAICDTDLSYIEKLAEYFICKKGDELQISTFSKVNIFLGMKKEKQFDIVLVGTGFEQKGESKKTVTVHISEDKTVQREELPSIFKYQRADEILRQVYEQYRKLEKEDVLLCTSKKEVIGIYSPCHSRMGTPFALTMGQILSEESKVIYVNLGEWAGLGELLGEEYKLDLSDLIYMISHGNGKIKGNLESVVHTIQRMDYIPPMEDAQLLCQTSASDYKALLKRLIDDSPYEKIFMDFGVMVPGFFDLLTYCNRIYGILENGNYAQGQKQQFEEGVRKSNIELLEKIEYISFSTMECQLLEKESSIQQWLYGGLGNRIRVIWGMEDGGN